MSINIFNETGKKLSAWEPEHWPVAPDWQPVLSAFLAQGSARKLGDFLSGRLAQEAVIYPPAPFHALQLTPLSQVKVVILGQDPYHGAGQAHGLAFSVQSGVRIPPSLRNIQKEIRRDTTAHLPAGGESAGEAFLTASLSSAPDGSLERWARQGVLLLNTCLTVEDGAPASHAKQGWEALTDGIIQAVWAKSPAVVFMLWGAHAQAKTGLLQAPNRNHLLQAPNRNHLVLAANHPSPLSALRPPKPFIGCGHFGLANAHLQKNGLPAVVW